MKDKLILVTGSTDGIGKQTALDLALMGARIIIHGRNESRAKEVVEELVEQSGSESVEYVVADFGSLAEIRKMTGEIQSRYKKLDVLINNAGVIKNNRELSKDGYEMTFAVNHLSYFLLTGLLLDMLKETDGSRIVNVASQAHANQLDFENLQGEIHYESYDAYSRSKLCNILFTYKLASMLQDSAITVNVLHPGVIRTKLLHAGWGGGGNPLDQGSKTSVYLATSDDVANISGKYFSNSKMINSSRISYDQVVQNKLWQLSEKYCNFPY